MIKKTSNRLEQVCSKHNIDFEKLPDESKQKLDVMMNKSDFDADVFAEALERAVHKRKVLNALEFFLYAVLGALLAFVTYRYLH